MKTARYENGQYLRPHSKAMRLRTHLVALLFVVLSATALLAQTTSSVRGHIADQQGMAIPDASVSIVNEALGVSRSIKSDSSGSFFVAALPAGIYIVETSKTGFAARRLNIELTVNQEATISVELAVASVTSEVSVTAENLLLDTTTSSTGSTITPRDIESQPLNGRNYLDMMQLVPGVTLNKQNDQGSDASVPVLGQRGNNTQFLIDGMPNNDSMNGGAAAQFNQDAILEFQVLTAGYKAEFGHGSGGIINVISRSGTNDWHGMGSVFYRTSALDSSDSNLVLNGDVPFMSRWDPSFQIGGPIKKDKIFFFAAAERIAQASELNFEFPSTTPDVILGLENPLNGHALDNETRGRVRLDEQFGVHRFSEQVNLTNSHINNWNPLSAWNSLPSTRTNFGSRSLMLGLSDVATLGNQSNPYILNYFAQYRDEPTLQTPSHPNSAQGIPLTNDNLFSQYGTGDLFGDQGQIEYGPGFNALPIRQKYWGVGANLARVLGKHTLKTGWNFERTLVDGTEAINYYNQLFSMESDVTQYGAIDSGLYYLNVQGSASTAHIGLRNNWNGLFLQDDWKVLEKLTLNAGLRWDDDSRFPSSGKITGNVSPRVGLAWQANSKTVVRASWGRFYDHFRMGLARDVPQFGGAFIPRVRYQAFPRLFYGNPSYITEHHIELGRDIPCVNYSDLTQAQINAQGLTCPADPTRPFYGIDFLNTVVANGNAPIPAGAVVNESNVQGLTGFTPGQFLNAAALAIGEQPGYWVWDPFGHLANTSVFAKYNIPITVDPSFSTPFTDTFHLGLQRQLSSTMSVAADYYHETIRNLLGVRDTNIAFIARMPGYEGTLIPGTGSQIIYGYGPWYGGFYDGVTVQFTKRMSKRFQLDVSYTFAKEWDNMLNSSLESNLQTGLGVAYSDNNGPTDSYKGIVPLVTDANTGQTNANGFFVNSNGNPVPKAGTRYNGADLDYGPSDLSVPHMFMAHGIVQLPWKFSFSDIFHAQSGFAWGESSANPPDADGDGLVNGRDWTFLRNANNAPAFINMDMRLAKNFTFHERFKFDAYFEMFNLLNRANPAAIQNLPQQPTPLGGVTQVLEGRQGQLGLKIAF